MKNIIYVSVCSCFVNFIGQTSLRILTHYLKHNLSQQKQELDKWENENSTYDVNNTIKLSFHLRYEVKSKKSRETGQFSEVRVEG